MGKFLSVDPLTADYPELTPYQFAGCSPIANVDLDGLEPTYYLNAWGGLSKHPSISGPYSEDLLNQYGLFSQRQYSKYQYEKQLRESISSAPQGPTMRATEYTDGSPHTLPIAKGLITAAPMIIEELAEIPAFVYYLGKGAYTDDYTDAKFSAIGLVIPGVSKSAISTVSDSYKAAHRLAKQVNGISKSEIPTAIYKKGDLLPNDLKDIHQPLDSRNIALYEYQVKDVNGNLVEKVYIRHDKAAKYRDGGKGDQTEHFNVYRKDSNGNYRDTKQHHNVKEQNRP